MKCRIRTALGIILMISLLATCGPAAPVVPTVPPVSTIPPPVTGVPPGPTLEPIISPNTKVLTGETTRRLVSISPDGTVFTFAETTPDLQALTSGDIIVGDVSPNAPYGFLRKVVAVSQVGNQVVVQTDRATLEEAIEQGSIDFQRTLSPAEVIGSWQEEGVHLVQVRTSQHGRAQLLRRFTLHLDDVVLLDGDGDNNTTNDQIVANGTLSFEPSYRFRLSIRGHRVEEVYFAYTASERAELTIESQMELFTLDETVEVAQYAFAPFTIVILGVPVVFVPVLTVEVGAEGNAHVGISASATQETTLTAGLQYIGGRWNPVRDLTITFDFVPPTLSGNMDLRGSVGPRLNLLVYGLPTGWAKIDGYLRLQVDIAATPWWQLFAGLEGVVGLDIEILGWTLVDTEKTVIQYEKLLAQAGTTPGVPPTRPPGEGGSATVLVMDVSGSMGDIWQGGVKLASAVDAASRIVRMIQHENEVIAGAHRVALVSFSTNARLDSPLTSDMDAILVQLAGYAPQENTNIGEGLQLANAQLANASPKESRIIILLSDGKANEGLAPDQILSGPAAEAARSGTCIYTIGFGDRGDLDEQLLQNIAAANPSCGGYYYALDYQQLLQVYVRLRHVSTGDLLAEQEGTIAQGQTINLAQFEVPTGIGELHVTLDWPGSTLRLLLTDPRGRTVDQNYPGARIFQEAASVYVLIQNPQPGIWQWSVQGLDIPEGTTRFFAAVSVRGAVVPPGGGGGSGFFILLLVAAVLVVVVFAVAYRRRPAAASPAALYVMDGPANQPAFYLADGLYILGRDPRCHIVLPDPLVSHQHAQLYAAAGTCYLADLNSANGTLVNQMYLPPLQWRMLRDGDVIQMGGTVLNFRQARS